MTSTDYTLTTPFSIEAEDSGPLLALTIAWHPDSSRIGEQFIGTTDEGPIEVSRFAPLFREPNADALPIGHGGVSRDPVRIERDSDNGITIFPSKGRMLVEVNGLEIQSAIYLSSEQVASGVIICLGRAVFLCVHWMRCLPKHNPVKGFIGVGSIAIMTRDLIRLAACNDSTVLLLGETGTGKEVAAQSIHALSQRAHERMVSVNMAALNEALAAADLFGASKGAYTGAQTTRAGFFSEAQNSTLFLDEIGNTPTTVQPMLLRVLESNEYRPLGTSKDVRSTARLITATDQNLYGGSFNHALVRRLESFIIRIAPLRERREDIGLLLLHILRQGDVGGVDASKLPPKLINDLLNFEWPGNIRQLSNVFKRMLLSLQMGDIPNLSSLVEQPTVTITDSAALRKIQTIAPSTFDDTLGGVTEVPRRKLSELNEQDVVDALEKNAWTIQYAANDLGISRPSMYKLIESSSQIRRVEQISAEEIRNNFRVAQDDVEKCASLLKTPSEALRRHLRGLGLIT